MIIAYWIVAALLALLSVGPGMLKLIRPKAAIRSMGAPFAWTDDFAQWQIKAIGAAEVLGAIGVLVPMATGILPVLSPIAALGLAILQAGAFVVHVRRGELPVANMVIFALAGATAVLGFFVLGGL
jgi:hypothetical protein